VSVSPAPSDLHLGRKHWRNICQLDEAAFDDPQARQAWQEAWTGLWEMFRPAMVSTVRRLVARIGCGVVAVDEADVIVQSLLLACLEHVYPATTYPEEGRFRTYVTVCLRRHTWRYVEHQLRKRRARTGMPDLSPTTATSGGASDYAFEEDWARCLVEAAMVEVAEESQPDAELLRHLLGRSTLTIDGLADRLGVPVTRIPHRLQRARSLITDAFKRAIDETVAHDEAFERERARFAGPLARHLAVEGAPAPLG
jgi:DNA-directed RNA polymerase specialized sigma24 family protein